MTDKELFERAILKEVEACIGVLGNPAYQGSYAAPREAFRAILLRAAALREREQQLKEISEALVRLMKAVFDEIDCICEFDSEGNHEKDCPVVMAREVLARYAEPATQPSPFGEGTPNTENDPLAAAKTAAFRKDTIPDDWHCWCETCMAIRKAFTQPTPQPSTVCKHCGRSEALHRPSDKACRRQHGWTETCHFDPVPSVGPALSAYDWIIRIYGADYAEDHGGPVIYDLMEHYALHRLAKRESQPEKESK